MTTIVDYMAPATTLPHDSAQAALAGRVWLPQVAGPAVAVVRDGALYDISALAPVSYTHLPSPRD